MQRFLGLILLGLAFNGNTAWASEPTVKVFDGQTVKLVPLSVYVESLTSTETAPFVDALPSEIADLQQQINDLRAAVAALTAKLNAPAVAPAAPAAFLSACGQASIGACGRAAAGACGAAQAGACGAAAEAGACGAAGSTGGVMMRQPVRTIFRSLFGRRGGC